MRSRLLSLFGQFPWCNPGDTERGIALRMRLLAGENASPYSSDGEEESIPAWMKDQPVVIGAYNQFYQQIDDLRKPVGSLLDMAAGLFCCNISQAEQTRAQILSDFMSDLRYTGEDVDGLRKGISVEDALIIINREKRNPRVFMPLERDKSVDGQRSKSYELLVNLETKVQQLCLSHQQLTNSSPKI